MTALSEFYPAATKEILDNLISSNRVGKCVTCDVYSSEKISGVWRHQFCLSDEEREEMGLVPKAYMEGDYLSPGYFRRFFGDSA